jgi:gluconate kinase
MPASLLSSQTATLEPLEPDEVGVVLDLRASPSTLVAQAARWVASGLPPQG